MHTSPLDPWPWLIVLYQSRVVELSSRDMVVSGSEWRQKESADGYSDDKAEQGRV